MPNPRLKVFQDLVRALASEDEAAICEATFGFGGADADLRQECALAALLTFRENRGKVPPEVLSRYCGRRIWLARQAYFRERCVVRVPAGGTKELMRYKDVLLESPDLRATAEKLGISYAKAFHIRAKAQAYLKANAFSLDAPDTSMDLPVFPVDHAPLRDVKFAVVTLPPKEAAVLTRYFGLDGKPPEDQAEIAKRSGCTRANISLQFKAGLKKLRRSRLLKELQDYPS